MKTGLGTLIWSRKVHFVWSWLGRHSIQTRFHQKWCPENFTPLAPWHTSTNAHSIIPYPMGGQIFKVIFLQFWLKIQIPCKKLREESVFLFCKFLQEHLQNQEKLQKTKLTLTYPQFFQFLSYLTHFLWEYWKKKDSFFRQFFAGNLNLQSEMQKNHFENLTSHRVGYNRVAVCGGMPWS